MSSPPLQLAVVGAATCDDHLESIAREAGRQIALRGATLICGGRGGVMAAAAAGAAEAGGRTIGILPGADTGESPPNAQIETAIFTGMGQARNQILVLSAAAVIAIGGGWGTLSEIALALKHGIPVVTVASWQLRRPDARIDPLLLRADSATEAVDIACRAASDTLSPELAT